MNCFHEDIFSKIVPCLKIIHLILHPGIPCQKAFDFLQALGVLLTTLKGLTDLLNAIGEI